MIRRLLPAASALLALALLAGACSTADSALPDPQGPSEEAPPPPEDIVSGVGTVQYVELEGGFYGLVADDSTRYLPQNLEAPYREDGLRLRFRAVKQDSVATTQMWGTPVELLDVLRLDDQ